MVNNFASFFYVGVGIVLGLLVLLGIMYRAVALLAVSHVINVWKRSIILIGITAIPFFLISLALMLNSAVAQSFQLYNIRTKGSFNWAVYSVSNESFLNKKDIENIQSIEGIDTTTILPVLSNTETVRVASEKNYNVHVFAFENDAYENFADKTIPELGRNEVLISTYNAKRLNVRVNDQVAINDIPFTVRYIQDDDGVIGYNGESPFKFFVPETALVVSLESMREIHAGNSGYNVLLVRDSKNEIRGKFSTIQNKLVSSYSDLRLIDVWANDISKRFIYGANIGQSILAISIVPIVLGLLLLVLTYKMYVQTDRSIFGFLTAYQSSPKKHIIFLVITNVLNTTLGGIAGVSAAFLLTPLFLNALINLGDQGVQRISYASIMQGSIGLESVGYAYAGSWLIVVMAVTLWGLSLLRFDLSNFLKGRHFKAHILWNTKRLLRILMYLVVVLVGWYLLSYIAPDALLKRIVSAFGFISLFWIFGYAFSFTYSVKAMYSIVSSGAILVIVLLFGFDNSLISNEYYSLFQIFRFLIISIHALILFFCCLYFASPYLSTLFQNVSNRLAVFLNVVTGTVTRNVLSVSVPTVLCVSVLFTLLISGVGISESYIQETQGKGYDLLLTDDTGRSNIQELASREFITSSLEIHMGSVELPKFTYQNIPGYDKEVQTSVTPETTYSTTIAILPEQLLEEQKYQFLQNKSLQDFQSGEYIILNRDFFLSSDSFNIRPDIKAGDRIQLKFGETVMERIVLGVVEETGSDTYLDPAIFFSRGILLSQKDYVNLQKEKVYFKSLYGFNIQSSSDIEQKLKDTFIDSQITDIQLKSQKQNRALTQVLQTVFYIIGISIIFILSLLYILLLRTSMLIQGSTILGFSRGFGYIMLIIFGCLCGSILTSSLYQFLSIPLPSLALRTEIAGTITSIFCVVVALSLLKRTKNYNENTI